MASEIATGARAKLSLNGVKVGFATGVDVRRSINYEPVEVLDNIEVEEHAPIGYQVSMSADMVRIVNDTLVSRGWFPSTGKSAAEHLANILNIGEMVATIQDSKTGKTIAHVEGVKISEENMRVVPRGIVGTNVTMVAKRVKDESELAS